MPQLLYETSSKKDGNISFKWGSREEVLRNRISFLQKFGRTANDCVYIEPEHGDTITHVNSENIGQIIKTEALITQEKGLILFLLTADCFPTVFYDHEKRIVALAHLGWKPIDKRLVGKVLRELTEVYSSRIENIKVLIGPGIHKDSYTFKNPQQKGLVGWSDFLIDLPNGETQIDLIGHIRKQLLDKGILLENIQISPTNTAASKEYFSHYRSVRTGEPEGRFATIVGLV